MDMTDIKAILELLEEQGRTFEQYRKVNDELIKAKAEGKAVGDLEAKLASMDERNGTISEIKQAVDTLMLAQQRHDLGGAESKDIATECKQFNAMRHAVATKGRVVTDLTPEVYAEYKAGFDAMLRHGQVDQLSDSQRKAMSAGSDPDGGYLMPAPAVGRIVARVFDLSPIRAISSVVTISGDALEGISDNDEASASWVGETASRDDTDTPNVGQYRIDVHEMYAQPKATQKLLDDAAVDVEAWLGRKVGDKFARAEGNAFIVGNGVAKPRGFASYSTAATADSSRTWGVLEHIKSGANGAFAASNPADILFDVIGALNQAYLGGARWVSRREAITAIRKFKEATTNAYMWQPGLQPGQPDTLLGYPITLAQDLATLATDSLSMAFGNFTEGYQIVDRLGIRVLRDPFTAKPYIRFYTTRRVGGAVVNFDAIKFVKFAA